MKTLVWIILTVLFSLNAVFIYQVVMAGQSGAIEENNMVEMIQLAWLLIAGIIFFVSRHHKSIPMHYISFPAVALCFSFIIREMSVKSTSAPDWLIYIIDGHGYKILMLAIWLPILTFIYRNFKSYWAMFMQLLFSKTFWLLVLAFALLLFSALFDKSIIVVEYFKLYEEILEMNAYALIVLAALQIKKDLDASKSVILD